MMSTISTISAGALRVLCMLAFAIAALAGKGQSNAGPKLINLQCEHLFNPIGIDCKQPRLSWQMDDARPGAKQVFYQVWLSTDSVALAQNGGLYWTSGKISNSLMLTHYGGKPLQPFTKYFWKVNAGDQNAKKISSAIASFETGMVDQSNWKGSWISDNSGIQVKPAPYFRRCV